MLEETSLRYLRVLSYLEDRRLGRGFLPDAAGLYWFVRDLVPMLKAGNAQMLDDWLERPRRWFAGEVSPYFRLHISNAVRSLGAAKVGCLKELTEKVGANTLSTPLLLAQRPLYIGESRNLQKRISDHIEGKTDLRELLAAAGLSPSDCVVMWTVLPETVGMLDTPQTDSDGLDDSPTQRKVVEALAIRLSYPLLNRKLE